MMERSVFLGLDIGSTTAKLALVAADGKLLEAQYLRHGAAVRQTLSTMLDQLALKYPGMAVSAAITGSASLGLSETLGLPFVQEVVAASRAIAVLAPQTDVAVELGGEDAKILYLSQGMDLRMNEACAGGTGAFIDQMAALLHTDASGLNELAANYTTLYPIASRCGVFAKTDVVPLLNRGPHGKTSPPPSFRPWSNRPSAGWPAGIPSGARSPSSAGRCTSCPNSANASSPRSSSRPKRWCRSRTPNIWSRSARP
ncbi:MAG: BadF/BadG/BcrA/BcrD ATPase family protein [Bilophila wadsworthia]